MRRAWRLPLALACLVLVLGIAVLATLRHHAAGRPPATLLELPAAAVTRITVQAGGGVMRRFEKRGDGWWMLAPRQGRADDAHLERLARLADAEVLGWRPASAFDAGKIGLAPPWAKVRLDGHTIAFGGLAALAPQRYVRVGSHVALIPARFAADIAATPDAELARASSTLPTL